MAEEDARPVTAPTCRCGGDPIGHVHTRMDRAAVTTTTEED